MQKQFYITTAIVIAGIVVSGGIVWLGSTRGSDGGAGNKKEPTFQPGGVSFAPEVESVLDERISLARELMADPAIIAGVRQANAEYEGITLAEIERLDQRWRSAEGVDEFIEPFLTNEVARALLEFQEDHPGFSEIFVTGMHGLNVGQTNKTTDFYQADEDWWVESYNNGKGKSFHGPIEFDESAQAEAISLYVPVMDAETLEVLGVAKAVVGIAAIKLEL